MLIQKEFISGLKKKVIMMSIRRCLVRLICRARTGYFNTGAFL
jgi:hypothetical protein